MSRYVETNIAELNRFAFRMIHDNRLFQSECRTDSSYRFRSGLKTNISSPFERMEKANAKPIVVTLETTILGLLRIFHSLLNKANAESLVVGLDYRLFHSLLK